MTTFLLAITLLIITPGPGVLTTAGVGSAFGWRPGVAFIFGLFLGSNLTSLLVVTGIAAAVLAVPGLRTVLLIGSISYLAWLAFKIAFAGAKVGFIETPKPPGAMGAFTLQMINPKAYVVGTTIFSGFPLGFSSFTNEVLFKFLALNVIWIPVHIMWLGAGVMLHRMDLPPRTQRAINIVMALAMLAVVALAASREMGT